MDSIHTVIWKSTKLEIKSWLQEHVEKLEHKWELGFLACPLIPESEFITVSWPFPFRCKSRCSRCYAISWSIDHNGKIQPVIRNGFSSYNVQNGSRYVHTGQNRGSKLPRPFPVPFGNIFLNFFILLPLSHLASSSISPTFYNFYPT